MKSHDQKGFRKPPSRLIDNFEDLVNQLPCMIWRAGPDMSMAYISKLWYEFTGRTPESDLGFGWLEAVHQKDADRLADIFLKARNEKSSFHTEFRLRDREGFYQWQLNCGKPEFDQAGNLSGFTGVLVNIQERKQREILWRESAEQYKKFAEGMPQMAFIGDKEGNMIYFNEAWYKYIGEIRGTEGWGWKEQLIHHPEDLERTVDTWMNALKNGTTYEIEYRLRRHDGQYRWHLGRANPVRDHRGEIKMWFGTNTDIHEQKEAEDSLRLANLNINRINKTLFQKNKQLEKVNQLNETLIYMIAHDLRNPVANMEIVIDMLDRISPGPQQKQWLKILSTLVGRQKSLLNGLVELIREQPSGDLKPSEIDLEEIIDDVIEDYERELLACGGKVEYNCKEAPVVSHVKSFVYSILKNLISNSIKYRREDAPLLIRINSRRTNKYVNLSIEDNGIGINMKSHGKIIFQPFKRLASKGEGIGVGLYLTKNLIEKFGGYIRVESTPGVGTVFNCYFLEKEKSTTA